ncbi:MAG: DndE family protein [Geminicoccaceae bacterium]|nr:DndE family protein [Geminicoccaceae bacterium]
MVLSLLDIAQQSFPTTAEADDRCERLRRDLNFKYRYSTARLAIARSLALPDRSPINPEDVDGLFRPIPAQQLFGDDLAAWVALLLQNAGRGDLNRDGLRRLVAAHWHRGAGLVAQDWEDCDRDLARFVEHLAQIGGLSLSGRGDGTTRADAETFSAKAVAVPIGELARDMATGEPCFWELNGPGGSPHGAVMGGVGSGKTRTAVAMLRSLREQAAVPLIAFDFKGDLGTDPEGKGYGLDRLFDATVVEPPRAAVPLDVLALESRDPIAVAEAASRFREAFARLKGNKLGDRQRDAVHEAAGRALRANDPCELHHVRDELVNVYAEREMKEDGAVSTMNEVCRFSLFQPTYAAGDFFRQSWIVRLPPNVVEESRSIVVNLILDALDRYLNSLSDAAVASDGSRGLRVLCLVDEAHRILGTRLPALSNLARMSRSKGGAVLLVSQSPDDFVGEDDDFLSEMGLVAAFSTNAPPKATARILGRGANLATLQTGQCYAKRRGDQAAKKVQAWLK